MSEAEGGAFPLDILYQQLLALTQVVKNLLDDHCRLKGCIQLLTLNSPGDTAMGTAFTFEPSTSTCASSVPTVILPPLEPRVPTPERFLGDWSAF